jgi:uncharacterized protein with LGFP repeats
MAQHRRIQRPTPVTQGCMRVAIRTGKPSLERCVIFCAAKSACQKKMKSCPSCNRTYSDDTITFCLVDGSVLSAPYDPDQTRRIPEPRTTQAASTEILPSAPSGSRPPLQSTIKVPAPNVPPIYSQPANIDDSPKRSIMPWLLVAAGIVIVGIVGMVAVVMLRVVKNAPSSRIQSSSPPVNTNQTNATMCGQTVSDAILDKWNQMGGESGKLGCPITQETDAPASPAASTGRWIRFAKGDGGYLIEHAPQTTEPNMKPAPLAGQVFEVTGCMFMLYSDLGGTKSWLGFPTGDGYEVNPGARQNFEAGYIEWDRKTYRCEAHPLPSK